jgi:hypothetical protein
MKIPKHPPRSVRPKSDRGITYTDEQREAYEAIMPTEEKPGEPQQLIEPLLRREGNLDPLDGKLPPLIEIRGSIEDWCAKETATWTSVTLISLNFKTSLITNGGQAFRLDEQTARNEVKKFGNRIGGRR